MTVIAIDKDICTGCQECTKICPNLAIKGLPHKPQEVQEDKCVKCGQCVQKCKSYVSIAEHGVSAYAKIRKQRGLLETITEPLFAAHNVSHLEEVLDALATPDKFTVVQCAPAVRVGIAEDFGAPLGTLAPWKLAAALRRLGFDRVYDTNFAADLTIMEEGSELIDRVSNGGLLPMFTSCCPAWVHYLELNFPDLRKHLSTCKSPQQMGGAIIKTYGAKLAKTSSEKIYSVSVMPCTAKQFECSRPEMADSGQRDVDVVLTTRELAWLIKKEGIDFLSLPDEKYDSPLGDYSGAGEIFGVTGGVMEAALRTGYELITGKAIPAIDVTVVRGTDGFRTAAMQVGDLTIKVGIVTGLKNVVPVIEKLKKGLLDLHFIEVMTCPQGCVTGGGQPKLILDTDFEEAYKARTAATYVHDQELPLRKSHENPSIKKVYSDFLKKPLGPESHKLLHTTYCGDPKHH
ncbi:MAG: [FeFe] hydrogenase, group A [Candidatus Adiutrix intracellularis]|jgi:ferredoxin hydrogenase|nr:[FeFe] hydrogenase, group A [Candidatus Adiutrix intracellularis]